MSYACSAILYDDRHMTVPHYDTILRRPGSPHCEGEAIFSSHVIPSKIYGTRDENIPTRWHSRCPTRTLQPYPPLFKGRKRNKRNSKAISDILCWYGRITSKSNKSLLPTTLLNLGDINLVGCGPSQHCSPHAAIVCALFEGCTKLRLNNNLNTTFFNLNLGKKLLRNPPLP